MKIYAQQLSSHLMPLKSSYTVASDELLLKLEACDAIRRAAPHLQRESYTPINATQWNDLLIDIQHRSLFSEKKLIEIKCDLLKVNQAVGELLQTCITKNTLEHTLLITLPKIDVAMQKTKWFTNFEASTLFIPIWPIERDAFPQWIKTRLHDAKLPTDTLLVNALVDLTEGNLLAAQQHIARLTLLPGTLEEKIAALNDQSRFTAFDWVESILEGNIMRSQRILRNLKDEGEEPLLIMWTLAQALRLCAEAHTSQKDLAIFFKENNIWPKRQKYLLSCIKRCSLTVLHDALQECAALDKALKGLSSESPWHHFLELTIRLTLV